MINWQEKEKQETAARIQSAEHAYEKNGVRYWRSNDAVIPPCVYKDAGMTCSAVHKAAYERHLDASLADYRKRMANHVPDEEQMFEMRAAFGPGVEVVNVITGRKVRT
jgi:hypothetical protein